MMSFKDWFSLDETKLNAAPMVRWMYRRKRNDDAIRNDPLMAKEPSSEFSDNPIPDDLVPVMASMQDQGQSNLAILKWLAGQGVKTTTSRINDRIRVYKRNQIDNADFADKQADEEIPKPLYRPRDFDAVTHSPHPRKATDINNPVDRAGGHGHGPAGGIRNRRRIARIMPRDAIIPPSD